MFAKVYLALKYKKEPNIVYTRKNKLGDNIVTFYELGLKQLFDSLTFNMNSHVHNGDIWKVKSVFNEFKNLWIIKPSDLCRGKGLEIISSLEELGPIIKSFHSGYNLKDFNHLQLNQPQEMSSSLARIGDTSKREGNSQRFPTINKLGLSKKANNSTVNVSRGYEEVSKEPKVQSEKKDKVISYPNNT